MKQFNVGKTLIQEFNPLHSIDETTSSFTSKKPKTQEEDRCILILNETSNCKLSHTRFLHNKRLSPSLVLVLLRHHNRFFNHLFFSLPKPKNQIAQTAIPAITDARDGAKRILQRRLHSPVKAC